MDSRVNERISLKLYCSPKINTLESPILLYRQLYEHWEGNWCATSDAGSSGFDSHPEFDMNDY